MRHDRRMWHGVALLAAALVAVPGHPARADGTEAGGVVAEDRDAPPAPSAPSPGELRSSEVFELTDGDISCGVDDTAPRGPQDGPDGGGDDGAPTAATAARGQDGALPAARERATRPPLDLRTATREQLEELPGIGRARAEAIVAFRERRPLRSVRDLQRIWGIGPRLVQRIAPLVTVTPAPPGPDPAVGGPAVGDPADGDPALGIPIIGDPPAPPPAPDGPPGVLPDPPGTVLAGGDRSG